MRKEYKVKDLAGVDTYITVIDGKLHSHIGNRLSPCHYSDELFAHISKQIKEQNGN